MISSPEKLHDFWRQPAPAGNAPESFIDLVGRSQALAKLMADLPPSARILEVGCNVGRNLAHLRDIGYTRLEGIEISPHAVEMLRSTYPQLADVPVHVGAAEEVLPGLETESFDLVFTMALILAIHPDNAAAFDHMARVARSILAIEPAGFSSRNYYPHDVPAMFTSRGFTLTESVDMTEFPEVDVQLKGFFAHRFARAADL